MTVRKRYPFARLAGAMGMSEHEACRTLGLRGASYVEYRRIGMSEKVADRWAVKAGFHPYEVWPDMADDHLAAEAARQRRLQADWKRRKYKTSAEFRGKIKARRVAYYAECGEYERARNRERYWRDRDRILQRRRARARTLRLVHELVDGSADEMEDEAS